MLDHPSDTTNHSPSPAHSAARAGVGSAADSAANSPSRASGLRAQVRSRYERSPAMQPRRTVISSQSLRDGSMHRSPRKVDEEAIKRDIELAMQRIHAKAALPAPTPRADPSQSLSSRPSAFSVAGNIDALNSTQSQANGLLGSAMPLGDAAARPINARGLVGETPHTSATNVQSNLTRHGFANTALNANAYHASATTSSQAGLVSGFAYQRSNAEGVAVASKSGGTFLGGTSIVAGNDTASGPSSLTSRFSAPAEAAQYDRNVRSAQTNHGVAMRNGDNAQQSIPVSLTTESGLRRDNMPLPRSSYSLPSQGQDRFANYQGRESSLNDRYTQLPTGNAEANAPKAASAYPPILASTSAASSLYANTAPANSPNPKPVRPVESAFSATANVADSPFVVSQPASTLALRFNAQHSPAKGSTLYPPVRQSDKYDTNVSDVNALSKPEPYRSEAAKPNTFNDSYSFVITPPSARTRVTDVDAGPQPGSFSSRINRQVGVRNSQHEYSAGITGSLASAKDLSNMDEAVGAKSGAFNAALSGTSFIPPSAPASSGPSPSMTTKVASIARTLLGSTKLNVDREDLTAMMPSNHPQANSRQSSVASPAAYTSSLTSGVYRDNNAGRAITSSAPVNQRAADLFDRIQASKARFRKSITDLMSTVGYNYSENRPENDCKPSDTAQPAQIAKAALNEGVTICEDVTRQVEAAIDAPRDHARNRKSVSVRGILLRVLVVLAIVALLIFVDSLLFVVVSRRKIGLPPAGIPRIVEDVIVRMFAVPEPLH